MVRNRSPVAAPHNSNTTTIMRSILSEFSDDTGRCSNQRRLHIIVPDHLQPSPDQIAISASFPIISPQFPECTGSGVPIAIIGCYFALASIFHHLRHRTRHPAVRDHLI
jgi:hypothetical protein